jgi:hypothetical protein
MFSFILPSLGSLIQCLVSLSSKIYESIATNCVLRATADDILEGNVLKEYKAGSLISSNSEKKITL